jgi:hypothetical protein
MGIAKNNFNRKQFEHLSPDKLSKNVETILHPLSIGLLFVHILRKGHFHCSRFARAGGANITQLSL